MVSDAGRQAVVCRDDIDEVLLHKTCPTSIWHLKKKVMDMVIYISRDDNLFNRIRGEVPVQWLR